MSAREPSQTVAERTPQEAPTSINRPARDPGGMECGNCFTVFIGEPWHLLCGVCAKAAGTL